MRGQSDASRHIDELAAKHGILIRRGVRRGSHKARAYSDRRVIITYGVNNDNDYLTALHEMGHIIARDSSKPNSETLWFEAEAWKWAIDTARWPIHRGSKLMIARCLASYRDSNKYQEPPADHVFHKMIGWLRYGDRPAPVRGRLP